jgi:hypothetical protein
LDTNILHIFQATDSLKFLILKKKLPHENFWLYGTFLKGYKSELEQVPDLHAPLSHLTPCGKGFTIFNFYIDTAQFGTGQGGCRESIWRTWLVPRLS